MILKAVFPACLTGCFLPLSVITAAQKTGPETAFFCNNVSFRALPTCRKLCNLMRYYQKGGEFHPGRQPT